MALVMGSTPGQDKALGENTIRGMRNLSNKIWNAARYILLQTKSDAAKSPSGDAELISETKQVVKDITEMLEKLRIGLAAEHIHNHFWHRFCDISIEQHKKGMLSTEALTESFQIYLKLLHPFMPFITEEIWAMVPRKTTDPLIISSWPE